MAIQNLNPTQSSLSSEFLTQEWNQPPASNENKITNDYIARALDGELLFENDIELQAQIDSLQGQIDGLDARLTIVEGEIVSLDARVTQNETDIATNTADIATNTANIAINTSAIADINDGRYRPQYGTGSPEGVVTANLNGSYYDLGAAPPEHWQNPANGSNTGWTLVSSSG